MIGTKWVNYCVCRYFSNYQQTQFALPVVGILIRLTAPMRLTALCSVQDNPDPRKILIYNTMMTSSNGNIFRVTAPLWRPVNSPQEGQGRGALLFSLIWAWINDWVHNRKAGALKRHRGHYDVNVMISEILEPLWTKRPANKNCWGILEYDMWEGNEINDFVSNRTHDALMYFIWRFIPLKF